MELPKSLTMDEVITKWSRKHRRALNEMLPYIAKSTDATIKIPKRVVRHMVTNQIMRDLGYKFKGNFTEKHTIYFKYVKEN